MTEIRCDGRARRCLIEPVGQIGNGMISEMERWSGRFEGSEVRLRRGAVVVLQDLSELFVIQIVFSPRNRLAPFGVPTLPFESSLFLQSVPPACIPDSHSSPLAEGCDLAAVWIPADGNDSGFVR